MRAVQPAVEMAGTASVSSSTGDGRHTVGRRTGSLVAASGAAQAPSGGLTLEVIEGPMDGAVWSGAGPRVTLGRASGNTLSLVLDRSISARHAVMSFDVASGSWVLEDLRSTNGTWLHGARLTTPQPTAPGDEFILGYAVIRLTYGGGEVFGLDPEELRKQAERLVARLSPAAAQGFGAAVMLASGEKRSYLTDRQMLIGIASLNSNLLSASPAQGGLTAEFVAQTLRQNEVWTGPRAWIARHLRAVAMDEVVLFANEMVVTPRLVRLLQAAEKEAGGSPIEPLHFVRAVLADGNNRPCELLRQAGSAPAAVLSSLQVVPASRTGEGGPGQALDESKLIRMPSSSGDVAVDAKARETAQAIEGLAAQYHLADPEERAKAMRGLLTDTLGRLTSVNRRKLLEQLRRHFPVLVGQRVETAELQALRKRVAELERALPVAGRPAAAPPAEPQWPLLAKDVKPDQREGGLVAARAVVDFAMTLERFIAATAHNLTTRGSATESIFIPGTRTTLRKLLAPALEGKGKAIEELLAYLGVVERWLVATTAAYHEGPAIWFSTFWAKMSPAGIETALSEAGKRRVFRIEEVELWNHFKELARSTNVELVSDEIMLVTGKRAAEQYARLKERKE